MDIYGKVRNIAGGKCFVPFRYQGQYEDEETGLYYNHFRYYSPESGTYISQDPIGLAGNNPNTYAYVKDVHTWVDVFGLDCGMGQKKIGPKVPDFHKNNFKNRKYTNRQVDGDEIFYKYHGENNRLGTTHNYLTKKKYSSLSELREDLAILDEWGVDIDRVTEFRPSKGTWISEGIAGVQKGVTGEVKMGGGYQGLIDVKNLPKSSVIRTTKLIFF